MIGKKCKKCGTFIEWPIEVFKCPECHTDIHDLADELTEEIKNDLELAKSVKRKARKDVSRILASSTKTRTSFFLDKELDLKLTQITNAEKEELKRLRMRLKRNDWPKNPKQFKGFIINEAIREYLENHDLP